MPILEFESDVLNTRREGEMTKSERKQRRRQNRIPMFLVVGATAALALTLALTCGERIMSSSPDGMDADYERSSFPGSRYSSDVTSTDLPVNEGLQSVIVSNFNGTAIPAGRTIWFSSVMKYKGPKSDPVTITVTEATIQFTADGTPYTLHVPSAVMTFDPQADLATTAYNYVTDTWESNYPFALSGNRFMSGAALNVPVDFPGGIKDVTWSGDFYSTAPGVEVEWKWAAAVYTEFSTDYNGLGVKVTDDTHGDIYANSHHAGTPENFRSFVVGGARGGGGSNWTGSLSGTAKVKNPPQPVSPSEEEEPEGGEIIDAE